MITNILLSLILIVNVINLLMTSNTDLLVNTIKYDIEAIRKHVFDIKLNKLIWGKEK